MHRSLSRAVLSFVCDTSRHGGTGWPGGVAAGPGPGGDDRGDQGVRPPAAGRARARRTCRCARSPGRSGWSRRPSTATSPAGTTCSPRSSSTRTTPWARTSRRPRRRVDRGDLARPVLRHRPRRARLGAGAPARVRADLRQPGAGLRRAAGHGRAGEPRRPSCSCAILADGHAARHARRSRPASGSTRRVRRRDGAASSRRMVPGRAAGRHGPRHDRLDRPLRRGELRGLRPAQRRDRRPPVLVRPPAALHGRPRRPAATAGLSVAPYAARMPAAAKLTVRPLTADRLGDLESLFGTNKTTAGCYCMWFLGPVKECHAGWGEANRDRFNELAGDRPTSRWVCSPTAAASRSAGAPPARGRGTPACCRLADPAQPRPGRGRPGLAGALLLRPARRPPQRCHHHPARGGGEAGQAARCAGDRGVPARRRPPAVRRRGVPRASSRSSPPAGSPWSTGPRPAASSCAAPSEPTDAHQPPRSP